MAKVIQDRLDLFDASALAKATLGDSIFSNMMIFGAAWQRGLVPLSHEAIMQAIELNGAAVERNKRAFEIGRWAVLHPEEADKILRPNVVALPKTVEEQIHVRADHLVAYQGKGLARRYRKFLEGIDDQTVLKSALKGYHKLLAYKDEYEVARLLLSSREKARAEFEGDFRMTFNLAPPMLARPGPDGRPMKREFGEWLEGPLRLLARLKVLRRTPFDPFGYTAERRMERALIRQYEGDMADVLPRLSDANRDAIAALAELPLQIRGFGPVKAANEAKAAKRREELLAMIRSEKNNTVRAAE